MHYSQWRVNQEFQNLGRKKKPTQQKTCISILNKFILFWCLLFEKYQNLYLSNLEEWGEIWVTTGLTVFKQIYEKVII